MSHFLNLAEKRSCVRGFTSQEVSQGQLVQLLRAAQAAPSAGNLQPWHFYVLKGRERISQLHGPVFSADWPCTASAVLCVCADAERSGEKYGERGRSLYCFQDTAAAVENILLCAVDLGLSACWIGDFDEDACRDGLHLPQNHRPVALIPVGYAKAPATHTPRRPLEEIVTFLGDQENLAMEEAPRSASEFRQQDLSGAIFEEVTLKNAAFAESDFSGAVISSCNLSGLCIRDCMIEGLTIGGIPVSDLIAGEMVE